MTDEPLLDDRDLARHLKLSPSAVRQRRFQARKLGVPAQLPPAVRLGRTHRYRPEDVRAWLARQIEHSDHLQPA